MHFVTKAHFNIALPSNATRGKQGSASFAGHGSAAGDSPVGSLMCGPGPTRQPPGPTAEDIVPLCLTKLVAPAAGD